jgi:UvrD-like helicase C-terminal domain/AAA domain/Exonuclease
MSSFNSIICHIKNEKLNDKTAVSKAKSNRYMKHMSKYLNGGLSKLKKNEIQQLIRAINTYRPGEYNICGKRIIPDEEQQQIIDAPLNSNMRVIAGAGTGKTTTILCRVKKLLDLDTTPDRILVLTFNVDAKDSLIKSARSMFGMDLKIDIRTIDSFCGKIRYDFAKAKTGFVSQSENCVIGYEIMKKYASVIASQYKYVFFDEFQDVNEEQFGILNLFARHGCYLTVIGDDCQNIYEFRGTNNYWIINFDSLIPNTLTYKITSNYRSTKDIVHLANDVITYNKIKINKSMKPFHAQKTGEIDLKVCRSKTYYSYIVQKIKTYIDEGISHHEIAILSRNGKPLKSIETELEKQKIPYTAMINDNAYESSRTSVQEGTITLTTIHKAKGLEWHAVFIVGLNDNFFPNHMNNGLTHIEEERRLFYVAVTRPKTNLHFVANEKEVPISRFVQEVIEHVTLKNTTKISEEKLFDFDNNDDKKKRYNVVDLLSHLSGKQISKMKKSGVIPDIAPQTTSVFDHKLDFSDEIKKGRYEPDYSIYCDRYLTRQLMVKNGQTLKDSNVEQIINAVFLTDDEKILYDKYDLRNYFVTGKHRYVIPPDHVVEVDTLVAKLQKIVDQRNLTGDDLDKFLLTQVGGDYYPDWLLDILEDAYATYCDPKKKTARNRRALYYVSLCAQFNSARKRLVYRDIYGLFKEDDRDILPRINQYVKMISSCNQISKVSVHKMYEIKEKPIMAFGEIDYIDATNSAIVMIKCSAGDFQMEWLVQLLAYYAIYMERDETAVDVEKLAVINIFNGTYYEFELPEDYDHTEMIDYLEEILCATLESKRDPIDFEVGLDDMLHDEEDLNQIGDHIKQEAMVVDLVRPPQTNKYMVLDLENNMGNGDIIQIAYSIHDYLDNEVKSVNAHIKDRYVDQRSRDKTGISTDKLRKEGKSFHAVAQELLQNLNEVTYIVGHNIHTDISKIISNLHKFDIHPSYNVFHHIKSIDTMKIYKDQSGKKASVGKMVEDLFEEEMIDAHDAMVDVNYTYRCYVEMKDRIETDTDMTNKDFIDKYGDQIEAILLHLQEIPEPDAYVDEEIEEEIEKEIEVIKEEKKKNSPKINKRSVLHAPSTKVIKKRKKPIHSMRTDLNMLTGMNKMVDSTVERNTKRKKKRKVKKN